MKHSFRLFQDLLQLDVRAAIGAAYARWGRSIDQSMDPPGDDRNDDAALMPKCDPDSATDAEEKDHEREQPREQG
jgi:hypothetical protein